MSIVAPGGIVRVGERIWAVGAVLIQGGERMYLLTSRRDVALMPAVVVEHQEQDAVRMGRRKTPC